MVVAAIVALVGAGVAFFLLPARAPVTDLGGGLGDDLGGDLGELIDGAAQ